MHRAHRCTLAGTVWAPTSANRVPARCHPLPGRPPCRPPYPCLAPLPAPLGLRFRALLGLGFVPPPEPRPCAHCASIAYALLPSSASLYVATEQIQNRRLGRCHREVPPASRPPRAAIRRVAHCSRGEPPIGLFPPPSCCPRRRIAPTDARSPAPPEPQPEPTESRPRANRASPTRGGICAHPRPATRCISPCRVGPAAVPVIPAKWCGDTIAHTRKLRF